MTTPNIPQTEAARISAGNTGLLLTLLVEVRQYGIAAIVMMICMAGIFLLFTRFEEVRREKDGEIKQLNEKVFVSFTENTKALAASANSQQAGAVAQQQTVQAIQDLRADIRRSSP